MLFGWTPAVKLSLCGSAFCCAGKHADRLPIVAAAFLAVLAIFYPGLDGQEEGPAARLRSEVNSELNFCPNFEGLVLGCIDADFCK